MEIVLSQKEQLSELTAIYNFYVRNTTVTFNLHELSIDQFETDFFRRGNLSGTYTITESEKIIGFCCMGNHFHLLVRMLPETDFSDVDIKERFKGFYGNGGDVAN